ncbi:uncharacterized protein M421DRAFT_346788 [Didymella exigua CBS 183.55]|uniref:Uncharacterized protein n=1 Tax=Didymella exigua CBS 183.55 TaxID=1150837 RepID=A0A6A5RWM0_9PLEO|nr:uncharacterized protein M421DRAFT_346788 [Didymella exigua CBS 183.55]KAF1931408.1 hypothetical protein M421DRAFT_346788 [Didymella exigua CBS 183.55]
MTSLPKWLCRTSGRSAEPGQNSRHGNAVSKPDATHSVRRWGNRVCNVGSPPIPAGESSTVPLYLFPYADKPRQLVRWLAHNDLDQDNLYDHLMTTVPCVHLSLFVSSVALAAPNIWLEACVGGVAIEMWRMCG